MKPTKWNLKKRPLSVVYFDDWKELTGVVLTWTLNLLKVLIYSAQKTLNINPDSFLLYCLKNL